MSTYTFNKHAIKHYFCPECGIHPFGEALSRHIVQTEEAHSRLSIEHVVTHGKAGAVNGTVEPESGAPRRFCHVMAFKNTKCQEVIRPVSYGS